MNVLHACVRACERRMDGCHGIRYWITHRTANHACIGSGNSVMRWEMWNVLYYFIVVWHSACCMVVRPCVWIVKAKVTQCLALARLPPLDGKTKKKTPEWYWMIRKGEKYATSYDLCEWNSSTYTTALRALIHRYTFRSLFRSTYSHIFWLTNIATWFMPPCTVRRSYCE